MREVLAELVPTAPGRLADRPDPGVGVAELGETAAVFSLSVWTPILPWPMSTAAWLRERSLARLADEGVFAGVSAEVVK